MSTKVLVPVEVLEGQTVGQGVVNVLENQDVVLLGYHVIPEQTAPEQARDSFGEKAREKLDDIASAFEGVAASVETLLVFTHDREQSLKRVAAQEDCDAVVRLNPAMAIDRILVALHGDVDAERIGSFAGRLIAGTDIDLHLLEVTTEGGESRDLLASARDALEDHGVSDDQYTEESISTDSPVAAIVEAAIDYDAIVVGEKGPSLSELVLGDFEERIAEGTVGPVFVVPAPKLEEIESGQ